MLEKLKKVLDMMCDLEFVEKTEMVDNFKVKCLDYVSLTTGEVLLSMHDGAIYWMCADVVKLLDKLA